MQFKRILLNTSIFVLNLILLLSIFNTIQKSLNSYIYIQNERIAYEKLLNEKYLLEQELEYKNSPDYLKSKILDVLNFVDNEYKVYYIPDEKIIKYQNLKELKNNIYGLDKIRKEQENGLLEWFKIFI